ncbi:MAG: serine protein kinase RIO [Methanobrevibacter sp.]|nr:serine protein kinase RIO [Methanobrevibacter sp.]
MDENPRVAKADAEVQKLISQKRIKDSDDRKVSSEIFDKATLQVLYKLANQGYLDVLNGAISTGKEANVLKGIKDDGSIVAVKIYRIATSDFKKMQYYIAGDPRFNVRSSNKTQLINNWVNKEFRNLTRLKAAGVNVPEAITSLSNVLIIEFIGDEEGNPAPTVKNLPPEDPIDFYEKLVDQMDRFINKANLIHGDLSSYNILNYDEEPVIIDVSQSVVKDHIIAGELLERDIKNISFEFSKMGVDTYIEDLTHRLIKD